MLILSSIIELADTVLVDVGDQLADWTSREFRIGARMSRYFKGFSSHNYVCGLVIIGRFEKLL